MSDVINFADYISPDKMAHIQLIDLIIPHLLGCASHVETMSTHQIQRELGIMVMNDRPPKNVWEATAKHAMKTIFHAEISAREQTGKKRRLPSSPKNKGPI